VNTLKPFYSIFTFLNKNIMIDNLLLRLKACKDARKWAQGKSWQEISTTCHRGDWLLWLFQKTAIDNNENLKLLTGAKAHCALTVRHLMKDQRSIDACEIALKFADGLATREELDTAANAANAAAAAANAAAYNDAAAAAYAADAAAAAAAYDAYAAAAADSASAASAAAGYTNTTAASTYAAYDDAADAKVKNQQETADICRKYLPIQVWNIVEDKQNL
jgi:hypothetical protein